MKLGKILVVAAVVGVSCPAARADLYPVGDPVAGNSWGQGFVFDGSGVGPIHLLTVSLISGGPFEPDVLREFDPAGWNIVAQGSTFATALGPAADNLMFEVWYASDSPSADDNLAFQLAAFGPTGDLPTESFTVARDGSQWDIGSSFWDITRDEALQGAQVPVPGAVLLGAIGLGLVGCWVKRRFS